MKRLILEIGSGADLYGQDYTKAALRALDDALRRSSILMFGALDLAHSEMQVEITIGVQDPSRVEIKQIADAVPRGKPNVKVVFGGQNVDPRGFGAPSVIASCAVEAFVPNMENRFAILR